MPYTKLSELPESVRNSLPKHGQEIYKSAFNSAWEEYGPGQTDNKRNEDDNPEEIAHRIAWSAVKKKYAKVKEGVWKAKD